MTTPRVVSAGVVLVCACLVSPATGRAAPVFNDTLEISSAIITSSDETTLLQLRYVGTGRRRMLDLRLATGGLLVDYEAFLFDATFSAARGSTGTQHIEFQVNPEYGTQGAASAAVEQFASALGHVPSVLRTRVATVSIHKGLHRSVAQNDNLVIHADFAEDKDRLGSLEELITHEVAHLALDQHLRTQGWRDARADDGEFVSQYAASAPDVEDVAESFVAYLAVRYRSDRIPSRARIMIEQTIQSRLRYFDSLALDLFPIGIELLPPANIRVDVTGARVSITWQRPQSGLSPVGYQLQAGSGAGLSDFGTTQATASELALTFDGVPAGTYYIRLRSVGPGGFIASSPDVVVNVGCARPAPPAPVRLVASVAGSQVSLSWDVDSPTPAAGAYLIEVGSGPRLADLAVFQVPGDRRLITASAPSGHYFVRMRSVGECAISSASPELTVTVP